LSSVALIVLAQGTSRTMCLVHTWQLNGRLTTIERKRGRSRQRHRGSDAGLLLP
jgi:hypothetical protein